jgi:hypothetical protein
MQEHWQAGGVMPTQSLDDLFEEAKRFEEAWKAKLGGELTEDLRFMLGIAIGRLIHGHSVDGEDLLAYITAVIREDGIPPTLKAL